MGCGDVAGIDIFEEGIARSARSLDALGLGV